MRIISFKRFILVFTCTFISILAFGQWSIVLDNKDFWLAGTYFLNADTGFVAGQDIEEYRGIILKTRDGGVTWDTVYYGEYGIVVPRVMDFIGPDTGYAAGQDGWLWRTFNGGENWELYTHAWAPIDIYNVCFLNSQIGFVDYAYTMDGGYNWTGLGFGFHTEFEKIGPEALLAAGDDGIFRTHNLGETWDTVLYIEGISFESISMTDDLTGYCTDNLSNLYKTLDGGGTWSLVNAPSFFELDRIQFVSEGTGYASFTQTDVPRIIRTEDEGETWTPELFCTDQIWGYQFIGSEAAFAVTADGKIYKTSNAGGATPPPRFMDANWVTTFHSNGFGCIFDSDNTNSGDLLFTAGVWDTLFTTNTFFVPPDSLSGYNLILGKVDQEGSPEWVRFIWHEIPNSASIQATIRINPVSQEIVIAFRDMYFTSRIMSFDYQGDLIWEEPFNPYTTADNIYIHESGEIRITGRFYQSATFKSNELQAPGSGFYLLRLDPNGSIIDFQKLADGYVEPTGITGDENSNTYIAVYISGPMVINGDTIVNTSNISRGNIMKFDSNLVFQWNRNLEEAGITAAIYDMKTGVDNNIFVAGRTYPWDGPAFTSLISAEGEIQFLKLFGQEVSKISMDITDENHVLVTGDFAGPLKVNADSIVSYGDTDQYFIELDAQGNLITLAHAWNIKDSWVGTPYPGKVNAYGSSFFINGTYKPEIHFLDQVLPGDYETNFFIANCGEMPGGYDSPPEPVSFRVFPNPSRGIFHLESKNERGHPSRILVNTMQGVEVLSMTGKRDSFRIDLSAQPPGIYLVTMEADGWRESCKIVIK